MLSIVIVYSNTFSLGTLVHLYLLHTRCNNCIVMYCNVLSRLIKVGTKIRNAINYYVLHYHMPYNESSQLKHSILS